MKLYISNLVFLFRIINLFIYFKVPSTQLEWLEVARGFNETWNFPHCIGAVDGKHIVMKAPAHGGSVYYNYKGTHSTVLMGISDSKYRFVYIDVGANGRISDGGVFRDCSFQRALSENKLLLPPTCTLPGRDISMPYVLVADDAFAFGSNIMKPYARKKLSAIERIFNYRLSRARRIIENTFGILSAKFQVFRKPLMVGPNRCRIITKSACALHNFLIDRNKSSHCIQPDLVDEYDANGHLVPGEWRQNLPEETFYGMEQQREAPTSKETLRNELAQYFVHEGEVPFQYANI